jgi:hypothetical protein
MGVKLEAIWWEEGARPRTTVWWDNFRRGQTFTGPEQRAERLAEWGAVWVEADITAKSVRCLEFENERDATMFLLRWA